MKSWQCNPRAPTSSHLTCNKSTDNWGGQRGLLYSQKERGYSLSKVLMRKKWKHRWVCGDNMSKESHVWLDWLNQSYDIYGRCPVIVDIDFNVILNRQLTERLDLVRDGDMYRFPTAPFASASPPSLRHIYGANFRFPPYRMRSHGTPA
jgi:hypothetical protein